MLAEKAGAWAFFVHTVKAGLPAFMMSKTGEICCFKMVFTFCASPEILVLFKGSVDWRKFPGSLAD